MWKKENLADSRQSVGGMQWRMVDGKQRQLGGERLLKRHIADDQRRENCRCVL